MKPSIYEESSRSPDVKDTRSIAVDILEEAVDNFDTP